MHGRYLFLPLAFALACAPEDRQAAAPADTADTAAARDTVPPPRAQIERIREEWRAAANRDDAAAVANLYTDDAVLVGAETGEVRGRSAIQTTFSQQFPASNVTRIESRNFEVSGDIAYDYGEFTQEVTPPNAPGQTVQGHYLVVLRRQGDGSWKIAHHVSSTPTAQQARR